MRALLIVMIAACQIPTEHFTKPGGGGGDGGTDGSSSDGKMPDTPVAGPSNAYAIDPSMGIFQLTRDRTTGALAVASSPVTPAPSSLMSVTDPNGSHLYVIVADANNPRIQAYAISNSGKLTASSVQPFPHCYPQSASMAPSGQFIAVGCSTAYVALVPIVNGELGVPNETAAGVAPAQGAWSNDGKCAFFADPSAAVGQPNVLAFSFNAVTQTLAPAGGVSGPSLSSAVATSPTSSFMFVAARGGNMGKVQQYQYNSACALTALFATVAIGTSVELAMVDPTGASLYITDGGLWAFTITATGLVPYASNPYFATTAIAFGIAIHPSLPHVVYVTGYAYQGTIIATNDGNGNISQTSTISPSGSTNFLQLEP